MVKYREILRLAALGFDNTEIAHGAGCHRNTVANVLRRAEERDITWPLPKEMGDKEVYKLLWPKDSTNVAYAQPDWQRVHDELGRKHVTLILLWQEYRDECIAANKPYYKRSAFNDNYSKWAATRDVVMHIQRRPAERLEVDWAGSTLQLVCRDTGEVVPVYVFVACLPYSGLIYAEGFLSRSSIMWLSANVNALSYIGGVPQSIVPDNCKTAVASRKGGDTTINKAYAEFAEHYGCAIIPTRPYSPRDKAQVEGAVGIVSRKVIASLRDEVFYTLNELNSSLAAKVEEINSAPFSRKPGSRRELFEAVEKASLLALPEAPYEVCTWMTATVASNYHVLADKSYYSVPYEYIKHKVDIRLSMKSVEVFSDGTRIAIHPRADEPYSFSTSRNHMPEDHLSWADNSLEGIITQTQDIGESVTMALLAIIANEPNGTKKQTDAKRFINLSRRYSPEALRVACTTVCELTAAHNITYDMVAYVIKTACCGSGIGDEDVADDNDGALLRGESYFAREVCADE